MTNETRHQVNFADCYVLTPKRTQAFLTSFLNTFIPHRKEYTSEYEVPQLAEHPTHVYHTASELIEYLEHHPHEVHAIYWFNGREEETVKGAMCLFTSDAQVIVGIFCVTHYPDTSIEERYLQQLMEFCQSTKGIIEYETPAAKDTTEFLQRIENKKSLSKGF